SLFEFSSTFCSDYGGYWSLPFVLQLTVLDSTGGNPEFGVFTVSTIGPHLRGAVSSLPANSTSPPLTGNWGLLAGPLMTSIVASDPDNLDGIFSAGDIITVTF